MKCSEQTRNTWYRYVPQLWSQDLRPAINQPRCVCPTSVHRGELYGGGANTTIQKKRVYLRCSLDRVNADGVEVSTRWRSCRLKHSRRPVHSLQSPYRRPVHEMGITCLSVSLSFPSSRPILAHVGRVTRHTSDAESVMSVKKQLPTSCHT